MKKTVKKLLYCCIALCVFSISEAKAETPSSPKGDFTFMGYSLGESLEELADKMPENSKIDATIAIKSKNIKHYTKSPKKYIDFQFRLPSTPYLENLHAKLKSDPSRNYINWRFSEEETRRLAAKNVFVHYAQIILNNTLFAYATYIQLPDSPPMPVLFSFRLDMDVYREVPSVFDERYGNTQRQRSAYFWETEKEFAIHGTVDNTSGTPFILFNKQLFNEFLEIALEIKDAVKKEQEEAAKSKQKSIRDSI